MGQSCTTPLLLRKKKPALLPQKGFTILLPSLKSNNLGFNIFDYLETLPALLILRSLSRKGMQFSLKFHLFAKPVRAKHFWKKSKFYRVVNPFKIPLVLTISCKKDIEKIAIW